MRTERIDSEAGRSKRPTAITGLEHFSIIAWPITHAILPQYLQWQPLAIYADFEEWLQKEGAYALIQSTKPQSLAPGLNDSPAGLAAWIVEKFRAWSDCGGDVESRFTRDELLTNVVIYGVTQSIGPSFLTYFDYANAGAMTWMTQGLKNWAGSSTVAAAFALFPADIGHPPREWAERFFNVKRWTEMPRGGHFAAMEEPELVAVDLRDRFRQFR